MRAAVTTQGSGPDRAQAGRVLLVIAAALAMLTVVFGTSVLRNRAVFVEYRDATIDNEARPLPWKIEAVAPARCVELAVDWAMKCPGMETWCSNEAPQVALDCMASSDRKDYCQELGEDFRDTHFGVDACLKLRESIEGTHAKRHHKVFCAAAYRAVAAHCSRVMGTE